MAKMRLDLLLMEFGLVRSRRLAQDLIAEGSVKIRNAKGEWQTIDKASQIFELKAEDIQVENSRLTQFVSRGGMKMQNALTRIKWSVLGKDVLDVGISKGGFSDCLLQMGARHIVGIDVGHEQVDQKIWSDPRVQVFEGVHVLKFNPVEHGLSTEWDLVVVDLSFISLSKVLPNLKAFLKNDGRLIALVKPQFEVGPDHVPRDGVVTDQKLHQELEGQMRVSAGSVGLKVLDYFPAEPKGADGNQEYFLYACRDEGH